MEVKTRCGPWENYLEFFFFAPACNSKKKNKMAGRKGVRRGYWISDSGNRRSSSATIPRWEYNSIVFHQSQQTTYASRGDRPVTWTGRYGGRRRAADKKCAPHNVQKSIVNNNVVRRNERFFFPQKPFKHVTSKNNYDNSQRGPARFQSNRMRYEFAHIFLTLLW